MAALSGLRKTLELVRSHALAPKYEILSVASVLLVKIFFEFWVFRSGFRSMGPDDFSKILISQSWSQNPFFATPHYVWLPLQFWTLGACLKVWLNPYFTSLLINSFFSILAITMLYNLTKLVFGPKIGLLSITIAVFFPWVVWLSISCPGESMSHFLALCGLFYLLKWRKSDNQRYLWMSSVSLLVFTMLRYYGWLFSFVFVIYITWKMVFDHKKTQKRACLFLAALLPCLFPVLWFSLNYIRYDSIFYFVTWYPKYVLQTGTQPLPVQPLLVKIFKYPFYLFITSPVISALSLVAFSYSVRKRNSLLSLYLFFILGYLFLSIIWGMRSGTSTEFYPQRYVVIPMLLLIPIVSNMISIYASSKRKMLAAAIFAFIIGWNLFSSLSYPKWDPSLERLGTYLHQIWDNGQFDVDDKVLIAEDAQFDTFPIKVFSRHANNILSDRPYYRSKSSVLLEDSQDIRQFTHENNVKMIIVQDAALIKRIPSDFRFLTCISGYKLFSTEEIEDTLEQQLNRTLRPKGSHHIRVAFDNKIELLGYFFPRGKFPKYAILYWKLFASSIVDYEVSIQFVNLDDRTIEFHTTALPMSGVFQDSQLMTDRYGEDRVSFFLPPEYPPGEYLLKIGITGSDSTRLPIVSSTDPGLLGKKEVSLGSNYIVLPSKKEFIVQFVKGENRNIRLFLTVLLSLLS